MTRLPLVVELYRQTGFFALLIIKKGRSISRLLFGGEQSQHQHRHDLTYLLRTP
jgi:hypothetical protein